MGKQAIDAPRKNYFMVDPEDLVIVGLDTNDGPEHPLYDERIKLPVSKKFVANVKARGVLQPIKVRKDGKDLQVVFGRRRVRGAREANIELKVEGMEEIRVPCVLEHGKDVDMASIMISENEHREDDLPMVKARKLQKLLALGRTEEECAIDFGVSTRSIKNWTQLLDLDDSVQKAIDAGLVKASAVASLHTLSREEQRAKLAEILEVGEQTGKRPTQRQAEKKAGTETAKSAAPTKRQILNMLKVDPNELYNLGLEDWFIKGLRVAIGDLSVTSIQGLSKALALGDEAAKERKKAKPKAEKKAKEPKPKKAKEGKKSKAEKKAQGKGDKGPRKPPKKKAKKKK